MRRCVECFRQTNNLIPSKLICISCTKKLFPDEFRRIQARKLDAPRQKVSTRKRKKPASRQTTKEQRQKIRELVIEILHQHSFIKMADLQLELEKRLGFPYSYYSLRVSILIPMAESGVIKRIPNPIKGGSYVYVLSSYEVKRTKQSPVLDLRRKRNSRVGRIVNYRRHAQSGILAPIVEYTHTVDGKKLATPYQQMVHPSTLVLAPSGIVRRLKP